MDEMQKAPELTLDGIEPVKDLTEVSEITTEVEKFTEQEKRLSMILRRRLI